MLPTLLNAQFILLARRVSFVRPCLSIQDVTLTDVKQTVFSSTSGIEQQSIRALSPRASSLNWHTFKTPDQLVSGHRLETIRRFEK